MSENLKLNFNIFNQKIKSTFGVWCCGLVFVCFFFFNWFCLFGLFWLVFVLWGFFNLQKIKPTETSVKPSRQCFIINSAQQNEVLGAESEGAAQHGITCVNSCQFGYISNMTVLSLYEEHSAGV